MLAFLIVVGATLVLDVALKERRKWAWGLYAVLVALGMWMHYFTALVWLAELGYIIYYMRRHGRQETVFWVYPLAVALFLPWVPSFLRQVASVQAGFWIAEVSLVTPLNFWAEGLSYTEAGAATGWLAMGLLAVMGLTVGLLVRVWRRRTNSEREGLRELLTLVVVPPALLMLVSLPPLSSTYMTRYVVYSAGLLMAVVGLAVVWGWEQAAAGREQAASKVVRRREWGRRGAAVMLAALTLVVTGVGIYKVDTRENTGEAYGVMTAMRPELAARIREEARKAGFQPDRAAGQLRRRRSNLIGILLPSLSIVNFYSELAGELHELILKHGYFPVFAFWIQMEEAVKAYRNIGLRLLGELGTAPEWASYFDPVIRCDSGYFKHYFAPRRAEDFACYAETVAGRYRGIIDEWFIWNEPWYPPFFAFGFDKTGKKHPSKYWSAPDAPEQYAALSAAAYDAVKKVNPEAVICGFNTRGFDPNQWSERVCNAGAMKKCDVLDYHFYAGRLLGYPNDDYAREAWQSAFGYIARKEGGKISRPIYMTEGQGSPESAGSSECRYVGLLKHTIPWEAKEDYHWLTDRNARLHLSLLAIGVKRIFVYSMHGNRNFAERARLRVMVNADGYPGPMLAGHSALTSRLEDKTYSGTRILEPGFGAYVFSDGKSSVAVLSGKNDIRGRRIGCSLPNVSGADLYGNPIPLPVRYDGLVLFLEAPVPAEVLKQSLVLNPK